MLDDILENYPDQEFLIADGFNEAVVGVDMKSMRLIYSVSKCLYILIQRDKMSEMEALEYFNFNVEGAYMGEQTPIWCNDII
jgi:hypothetical protein